MAFLLTCETTGPEYDTLAAVTKSLNLQEGTDMHFGALEYREMPTVYRQAKACVVPSRRESFGQVVLEAFLFGVPVVAAAPALKEIVTHKRNGLLFTDGDPDDLAEQLRRILAEVRLVDRLRENASEDVRTNYSDEQMVRRYKDLYNRLLSSKAQK